MTKFFFPFQVAAFLLFSGCHFFQKNETHFTDIKIEVRADDFKVPIKIFDQIEADLVGTATLQAAYLMAPLEVVLSSESNGVVQNSPIRLIFPNGGGRLDLANYVSGQGSFDLSFPPQQFADLPQLEKLYFISDSPKKRIDGEEFGLGCGKFVDIKKKFDLLQKPHFLKLNTTNLRYLYVVAGYYLFVFKNNNQFYLTHLHVTDSRYPDNFCSSLYKQ
ncbi:MAG: hypothetical protein H7Z71_10710 [Moraxellaceae bacterium]|nr:hypothetical protein [Pseudobdellovibrionaceae bacterium]